MNVISFFIEVSKLAVMAIILWHVCNFIGIPEVPKRACQLLIVFIAILAAIQMVLAGAVPLHASYGGTVPSIIAPERR